MASTLFNDSQAIILPPHQSGPDQYFHNDHYRQVDAAPTPAGLPTPPNSASQPPTPGEGALAGRKRSRADIFSPEDDHLDGSLPMIQPNDVPHSFGADPVYGPGMTVVYPNDLSGHFNVDPNGQGFQQKAERPIMATRKSQRLDSTGSRSIDLSANPVPSASRAAGTEPLIDEATRLLGVSWTRMDATEGTSIAQRAYTRWIQRHYHNLTNIELWFENSAIPGYLGKATNKQTGIDEFYLWSYDLHQAILVTRQPSDLVVKLSSPHMSLSQATDKIQADIEPVVEAAAANAAILHNDRFVIDEPSASSGMEVD